MLEVSDLKVAYGAIEAVHGLNLSLNAGDSLALLGPNGAGKTATVEAIVGLIPKRQGAVKLDGVDISRWPASSVVKHGIALVPQWRDLFPEFTVQENLLAANAAARGRAPKPIEYVYGLFPVLEERRRQKCGSLSGGEQQMLATGRALVTAPTMLLLDEPSA